MQTWRRMVGLMLVVGLLGLAGLGVAWAEDEPKLTGDQRQAADDAEHIGYLSTAARLKEYGNKYNSPVALITAGELLLKVHKYTKGDLEKISEPVVDEKGNKLDEPAVEETGLDKQAESLFDSARGLLSDSPSVAAKLIKDAEARAAKAKYRERGVRGGPRRISRKVSAGSQQHYTLQFVNGQVAAVAIQSSHPVRFVIRDPAVGPLFNMVVTTGHYTWAPRGRSTGSTPIKVEVHGMGRMAQYTIQTN